MGEFRILQGLWTGYEDQLVVAGFFVELLFDGGAGKLGDDEFAGGIDDAALRQVAAEGGEVFPRQGDVEVTASAAHGAAQADDLTMLRDIPDGNAAGIPDSSTGDTAHSGEDDTGGDLLFFAQRPDGQQQIRTPAQAQAVAAEGAGGGDDREQVHTVSPSILYQEHYTTVKSLLSTVGIFVDIFGFLPEIGIVA